jgi:hypothetical protein
MEKNNLKFELIKHTYLAANFGCIIFQALILLLMYSNGGSLLLYDHTFILPIECIIASILVGVNFIVLIKSVNGIGKR